MSVRVPGGHGGDGARCPRCRQQAPTKRVPTYKYGFESGFVEVMAVHFKGSKVCDGSGQLPRRKQQ